MSRISKLQLEDKDQDSISISFEMFGLDVRKDIDHDDFEEFLEDNNQLDYVDFCDPERTPYQFYIETEQEKIILEQAKEYIEKLVRDNINSEAIAA